MLDNLFSTVSPEKATEIYSKWNNIDIRKRIGFRIYPALT